MAVAGGSVGQRSPTTREPVSSAARVWKAGIRVAEAVQRDRNCLLGQPVAQFHAARTGHLASSSSATSGRAATATRTSSSTLPTKRTRCWRSEPIDVANAASSPRSVTATPRWRVARSRTCATAEDDAGTPTPGAQCRHDGRRRGRGRGRPARYRRQPDQHAGRAVPEDVRLHSRPVSSRPAPNSARHAASSSAAARRTQATLSSSRTVAASAVNAAAAGSSLPAVASTTCGASDQLPNSIT